jgi:hypothetical protein
VGIVEEAKAGKEKRAEGISRSREVTDPFMREKRQNLKHFATRERGKGQEGERIVSQRFWCGHLRARSPLG